ncbi:MAG: hypothetical protein HY047_12595 [Acidobacteria bacterium]|nr:hypothetical protein [Acidobacteriota bacterium]
MFGSLIPVSSPVSETFGTMYARAMTPMAGMGALMLSDPFTSTLFRLADTSVYFASRMPPTKT